MKSASVQKTTSTEGPPLPIAEAHEVSEACGPRRVQMTTLQQLLNQKGRKIWSAHPNATVFDAVAKMAEKDIGSLVVMDGDELVGIITERHYARNVILKGNEFALI